MFYIPLSKCTCKSCKKEPFTNVYKYWNKKLKEFKDPPFNLGKPSGLLKFQNNVECPKGTQNYVPQSKIAFRPTKRGDGCTYLEMEYPQ